MRGLLLKDYYTMIKQLKLFLGLIVFFALIPNFSVSSFALIYAAMMPITTLAYDERSHWDRMAATMPYSPASLVMSKYLLGGICIAASAVLVALGSVVRTAFFQGADGAVWLELLISVSIALLLLSLNLPLMFWLGVEKGRLIFFVMIAAAAFCVAAFGAKLAPLLESGGQLLSGAYFLPVLSLLLFGFSALISTYLYQRKEF